MTLQQMLYAITISETGSLNKAAEKLYISQPSLTSSIQELEKELGIQLFTRTGRGTTITNDGLEFINYAKQVYSQYEVILEKYVNAGSVKRKFAVSTQHYSFAVKAFVSMVKSYDTDEYEFAIRETMTHNVISDVASLRSEIGIIYLSDFNRKVLTRLLSANSLEFHSLIKCNAFVYMRKGHPLEGKGCVTYDDLKPYPSLIFEQGDSTSFYYSEELISGIDSPKMIKARDRATMLNLMIGLDGYTICSGIICEELNGPNYITIPLDAGDREEGVGMDVGYIMRKHSQLSSLGFSYVEQLKKYLKEG